MIVIMGRSEDVEPVPVAVCADPLLAQATVQTLQGYDATYPRPLARQDATVSAAQELQLQRQAWEENHPAGRADLDQFWCVAVSVVQCASTE